MKKYITLLLLALVGVFLSGSAANGSYYGSSKSNVYHTPSCQYVKKIAAEHMVAFQTKNEAEKKGYRPCKVCKP